MRRRERLTVAWAMVLVACGARSALDGDDPGAGGAAGTGDAGGGFTRATSVAGSGTSPQATTTAPASGVSGSSVSGAVAACWPETLALDGMGGQYVAFVDPGRLVYSTRSRQLARAVFAATPGEPAVEEGIATGLSLGALAVAGTSVYFDQEGSGGFVLAEIELDAGVYRAFTALSVLPTAIAADATGIYVADQTAANQGRLLRFLHEDGMPQTVLDPVGMVWPWPMVLAGDRIVTAARFTPSAPDFDGVISVAKDAGTPVIALAAQTDAIPQLRVDGNFVYWMETDGGIDGVSVLRRVSLTGGVPETLATVAGFATGLTSDATRFYVTSTAGDARVRSSTLYALPRDGFSPTAVFESDEETYGNVDVSGGRIAWTVRNVREPGGPSVRVACTESFL